MDTPLSAFLAETPNSLPTPSGAATYANSEPASERTSPGPNPAGAIENAVAEPQTNPDPANMRTSPPSASAAPKTSTGDTPRKDDATGATPPSHERLTTDSSDATGGTPPSYEPLTTNSPQYDIHTLTPLQQRAIDLLAAGYSAVHAADTLGITTRTIRRWKRAQPEFIAEYNRRVAEHSSVVAGHLRHLVDLAVNQVESVFRGRNAKLRTSASLRILSSLVGRHVAHRHGPLTGQEVLAEFVKQRLRAHNENDKQPLTTYFCEDYLFELTNYLGEEALKDQQEQCSE